MEKSFKIMTSIIAAVFIILAISGFSDGVSHNNEPDRHVVTTGSGIFMAEEFPYKTDFAIKEIATYFSSGTANQISPKQQQVQRAVIHVLEVQVACAILQCISQLYNHPVRLRKSDMLFPFHYFFESHRA